MESVCLMILLSTCFNMWFEYPSYINYWEATFSNPSNKIESRCGPNFVKYYKLTLFIWFQHSHYKINVHDTCDKSEQV